KLVNNYDQIVIEDLAVKEMMMTHVASKGMQRSLFSKFRQILTYKCDWYGKELILADKDTHQLKDVLNEGMSKKVMKKSLCKVTNSMVLNIMSIFVINVAKRMIEMKMRF